MIRVLLVPRNTRILFLYMFLLGFSAFLGGCRTRQSGDLAREKEPTSQLQEVIAQEKETQIQSPESVNKKKEPPQMIQIQNLTITEKTLNLKYQVSNTFTEDIRICQGICVYGGSPHVATIIDGETVWIKLRFNIKKDILLRNPPAISKYLRLPPGKSNSGEILLNLPIRNDSPVNSFWEEEHKERRQIILRRVVFEVGYFGPNTNKVFDSIYELMKEQGIFKEFGIKPEITVVGGLHYLPFSPLTVKEIQDGRSCEVVYVDEHCELISAEESEKAVVNDVEIPCSVVVDDK